MRVDVPVPAPVTTFYTRVGSVLGWACVGVAALLIWRTRSSSEPNQGRITRLAAPATAGCALDRRHRIATAAGRASQNPEAGMSTTPSATSARRLQPSDCGTGLDVDCSRADTARPHTNKTTPNRTNHTTAPVIGSLPTVSKTPRRTIDDNTLPNTTIAKRVWTLDTLLN